MHLDAAPMIIVTDAHLTQASRSSRDFFRMLAGLGKSDHDIIFLGDIFDLWIALSRYEEEIHRRFLEWCRTQKAWRQIGFIEGNHEFFIAEERAAYFSWCTDGTWRSATGDLVLTHGDRINSLDKKYLRFRRLTKNRLAKFSMRFLPFGPRMANLLKLQLKETNQQICDRIPYEEIRRFATENFLNGVSTIVAGHFHCDYRYRYSKSQTLYTVPDWHTSQKVTVLDPATGEVESIVWTDL
jgi:UDP-2,3-diacylglucosamine hydrolase